MAPKSKNAKDNKKAPAEKDADDAKKGNVDDTDTGRAKKSEEDRQSVSKDAKERMMALKEGKKAEPDAYTKYAIEVATKREKEAKEKEKEKAKLKANAAISVKVKETKQTTKVTAKPKPEKDDGKGSAEEEKKKKMGKKGKDPKNKNIVCILNDSHFGELSEMPELLTELNMMLRQQRDDVTGFGDIVNVVKSAVKDLEQRHASHAYQLVWRIDNFYKRFKDAKDKIKPIVFSPSFDTHPYGYRMALSMCPYGDGKFRGRYMSVFYCLLQSENDALQTWPFFLPFTISLVSQAADEAERVDHMTSFTPNPVNENKVFLGRPEAARNPSLGFPKFIALEELWEDEFVKDDQLFIKVQVDTSSAVMV